MTHAADDGGAACAKVIWWRAKPGLLAAYSQYLRDHVEPIDAAAVEEGVLLHHATWVDARPDAPWTHMRVFEFASPEARAGMKAAFARIAVRLTPDADARAARAAHAATLRDLVGEQDVDRLGHA